MDFMIRLAGLTGQKFLKYIDYILSLSGLLYRILKIYITRNYKGKSLVKIGIIEQIYFTAVQALWLVIPISLILGTAFFLRLSQLTGEYSFGKIAATLIIREVGPMIIAVLVILRSATAVTIEIGYMNVRKEMDSIQMSGVDPIALVCIPRLVGITSAILCLIIVFNLVAIFGGYLGAWMLSDISLSNFFSIISKSITAMDVAAGFIKGISFGGLITTICIFRGFEANVSITEVPGQASKASVECFFYCLLINALISILFFITG